MLGVMVMSGGLAGQRLQRRWAHRVRVVEAVVLLVLAAVAQRWVAMTRWSGVLGQSAAVPSASRGQAISELPARAASAAEWHAMVAVRRARRMVPWSPRCLAEATAAQVLLRQLGEPGVVVIGLRRPDDHIAGQMWDAHAWLMGRHGALVGGPAAEGFTATSVFEVPGGLHAVDIELEPGAA
jgi:hypothetical protein